MQFPPPLPPKVGCTHCIENESDAPLKKGDLALKLFSLKEGRKSIERINFRFTITVRFYGDFDFSKI